MVMVGVQQVEDKVNTWHRRGWNQPAQFTACKQAHPLDQRCGPTLNIQAVIASLSA